MLDEDSEDIMPSVDSVLSELLLSVDDEDKASDVEDVELSELVEFTESELLLLLLIEELDDVSSPKVWVDNEDSL